MIRWLKPRDPVCATSQRARRTLWRAIGVAALMAATTAAAALDPAAAPSAAAATARDLAPAPPQLVLPAPTNDPRTVDFTTDPVLIFVRSPASTATPQDGFRAAVAAAVARHPVRAEAEANTDTARAQRREVRAGLFPSISATVVGSQSLARDFIDTSAAVERLLPRGRTDANLAADQLLFDFGATGARIGWATARLRAAKAAADGAAIALAQSATQACYEIIAYQALTELSDALVARHQSILAYTKTRIDAGVGAGGDLARAEAGLADALGDRARSIRLLAAARARYRELFGTEAPQHPVRPPMDAPMQDDPILSRDAALDKSRRTPDVANAEALAQAAHAEARAIRRDTLPRVTAGFAATRYNILGVGPNYDVRGQFQLRQSFSAGGADAARINAADARARAATAAADRSRVEAERDAEAAFADARILASAALALADAYRANRRNRDITAEQFRLSRGSLIELLRAESDYFAAARALVLGRIEQDLAGYTLLARTGGLLTHFAIPPAH